MFIKIRLLLKVMKNRYHPNWKQLLPTYGLYQMKKDYDAGKPTIIALGDDIDTCLGFLMYHVVSTMAATVGVGYLTYTLAEKLF